MNRFPVSLVALVLAAITIVLHSTLHSNGFSIVVAPFVFAIWFSFVREPSPWLMAALVIMSELLAGTTPGAMAAALLLPLGIRLLFASLTVSFTFSFFATVLGIVAAQAIIALALTAYAGNHWVLPLPAIATILGSAAWSFLVCVVWYEIVDRIKIR